LNLIHHLTESQRSFSRRLVDVRGELLRNNSSK